MKVSRDGLVAAELVTSGGGYAVGLEETSEVLINVTARCPLACIPLVVDMCQRTFHLPLGRTLMLHAVHLTPDVEVEETCALDARHLSPPPRRCAPGCREALSTRRQVATCGSSSTKDRAGGRWQA